MEHILFLLFDLIFLSCYVSFVISDSTNEKCRKSSRINTAMAINGLTTLLVARLDHQDAIARLNLLKLIKVIFVSFNEETVVYYK